MDVAYVDVAKKRTACMVTNIGYGVCTDPGYWFDVY